MDYEAGCSSKSSVFILTAVNALITPRSRLRPLGGASRDFLQRQHVGLIHFSVNIAL